MTASIGPSSRAAWSERVEVGAGKELGEYAGAGAGRAAGEPAAVGVTVAVDGTGRVVEEVFADAFEDERRTEDRVPGAGGEGAGGDLGGAAVGHAGVDGDAGRGAAELGAGKDDVGEGAERQTELVEGGGRPGVGDQVVAGLEGVTGVGGDRVTDQVGRDEVGAVDDAMVGEVVTVCDQREDLRERPGGLHRGRPAVRIGVHDAVTTVGRAGVVVHERGGDRAAAQVGEEEGAGGGADGDAVDPGLR